MVRPIDFKVNNLGVQKNVIRIDSTEKVGINTSPAEALDVAGSYKQVIILSYKVQQIVLVLEQALLRFWRCWYC